MARTVRFKGFHIDLLFTLPVPPGFPAEKSRVRMADAVPKEAIGAVMVIARDMITTLSTAISEADPFKGWAPFAGGIDVQPDYEIIDTP